MIFSRKYVSTIFHRLLLTSREYYSRNNLMHLILDDSGLTRYGKGWALVGISMDADWSFRTIPAVNVLEGHLIQIYKANHCVWLK